MIYEHFKKTVSSIQINLHIPRWETRSINYIQDSELLNLANKISAAVDVIGIWKHRGFVVPVNRQLVLVAILGVDSRITKDFEVYHPTASHIERVLVLSSSISSFH